MTEEHLAFIRKEIVSAVDLSVPPAIEKYVNGGIRHLREDLNMHIIQHEEDTKKIYQKLDEALPLVEAYKGWKVAGEGVKWLAGVGVAYLVVTGWLKP